MIGFTSASLDCFSVLFYLTASPPLLQCGFIEKNVNIFGCVYSQACTASLATASVIIRRDQDLKY